MKLVRGERYPSLQIEPRLRLKLEGVAEAVADSASTLEGLYPFQAFARQLANLLAGLYREVEAPIISKFAANGPVISGLGGTLAATQPRMRLAVGGATQGPLLTQPPAVLMASDDDDVKDKDADRSFSRGSRIPTKRSASSGPAQNQDRAIGQHPSKSGVRNRGQDAGSLQLGGAKDPQSDSSDSSDHSSFNLTLDSQPILTSLAPPVSHTKPRGKAGSKTAAPPKDGGSLEYPAELEEFCAQLPIVPASAFRHVLCRGQDELLADILECKDPEVVQFLTSPRPSRVPPPPPKIISGGEDPAGRPALHPLDKPSILDRNDTAERIPWSSSATTTPPKIKNLPATPPPRPADISSSRSSRSPPLVELLPPSHASPAPPPQHGKRKWSEAEVENLVEGYKRFGRNWVRILEHFKFDQRTNVDLKDKARHLRKIGLIV